MYIYIYIYIAFFYCEHHRQTEDEIAISLGCEASYAAAVAETLEHNVEAVPMMSGSAASAEVPPGKEDANKEPPKKKQRVPRAQATGGGAKP